MARRSKFEIYLDILRVISNGNHKPTHVMYRANLSWERLKGYLKFLQTQDLVTGNSGEDGKRYHITAKGREVLNYFKKIEGMLYYKRKALPSEIVVHFT